MGESPILVILRESPMPSRTLKSAEGILRQWRSNVTRVVLFSPRAELRSGVAGEIPRVEVILAEEDWAGQILRLVREAGSRWVVLPSYLDQYLPGAFEAVLSAPAKEGQSVVGPCYIREEGRRWLVGPHPFRFDYYTFLFQSNYVPPGAAFLDAGTFVATGGLDSRFPTAGVREYLLRVGAGGGVVALDYPVVETVADPFLGIPHEYAARYAVETIGITFQYNRAGFTPGATLELATAISTRLDGLPTLADHALPLHRLTGKLRRDLEVALRSSFPRLSGTGEAKTVTKGSKNTESVRFGEEWWRVVIALVKRVAPGPLWNFLKRCRNAWVAFRRSPL